MQVDQEIRKMLERGLFGNEQSILFLVYYLLAIEIYLHFLNFLVQMISHFTKQNIHVQDCVHTMPAHFENGEKLDG